MKKFLMLMTALAAAGWVRAEMPPLDGTNVVGFAAVNAAGGANTLITVPFEACLNAGTPGVLADLISTNGLVSHASDPGAADQLIVLTTNATMQIYYYYWLKAGEGWKGVETSVKMPNGSSFAVTPVAASEFPVARGLGFWIKRVAGAAADVYVKGQVSGARQATAISEKLNLIGYGSVEAFSLNNSGIDWTGVTGAGLKLYESDTIMLPKTGGGFTTYFYYVNASPPAPHVSLTNKWVESTASGLQAASGTIAAGQGFWFNRLTGHGSFTFRPNGQE